jgi:hypothetical protein
VMKTFINVENKCYDVIFLETGKRSLIGVPTFAPPTFAPR